MNPEAAKSLDLLRQKLRKASIATLGGFRPPADPCVSYFGAGVGCRERTSWHLVEDDAPGWEDGWNVLDLDAVNQDEAATDAFFDNFSRYANTKVGGYPKEIQHGVGLHNFVFQVGSEEKSRWMWGDNGIGYFFKDAEGAWSWSCQFY
ncbi:DUF1963 domain-containing protein [Undibacterium sp. JH2W]|uniref:DUF1963 domain-containing protein n=1 Tax=Undibacterium sp. JH2W TaxID=3413037 RepID=UPI003BF3CF51